MSSILIITCPNCGNRMDYSGRTDPEGYHNNIKGEQND
jgi:hypothetical protein